MFITKLNAAFRNLRFRYTVSPVNLNIRRQNSVSKNMDVLLNSLHFFFTIQVAAT